MFLFFSCKWTIFHSYVSLLKGVGDHGRSSWEHLHRFDGIIHHFERFLLINVESKSVKNRSFKKRLEMVNSPISEYLMNWAGFCELVLGFFISYIQYSVVGIDAAGYQWFIRFLSFEQRPIQLYPTDFSGRFRGNHPMYTGFSVENHPRKGLYF